MAGMRTTFGSPLYADAPSRRSTARSSARFRAPVRSSSARRTHPHSDGRATPTTRSSARRGTRGTPSVRQVVRAGGRAPRWGRAWRRSRPRPTAVGRCGSRLRCAGLLGTSPRGLIGRDRAPQLDDLLNTAGMSQCDRGRRRARGVGAGRAHRLATSTSSDRFGARSTCRPTRVVACRTFAPTSIHGRGGVHATLGVIEPTRDPRRDDRRRCSTMRTSLGWFMVSSAELPRLSPWSRTNGTVRARPCAACST